MITLIYAYERAMKKTQPELHAGRMIFAHITRLGEQQK